LRQKIDKGEKFSDVDMNAVDKKIDGQLLLTWHFVVAFFSIQFSECFNPAISCDLDTSEPDEIVLF